LQNQERSHRAAKNEKNAADAPGGAIRRHPLPFRALRGKLNFEKLDQLLWRRFSGSVFVHGFFGMFGATHHEKANVAPFFAFMALLLVGEIVGKLFEGQAFWMVAFPRYWVFPLQTVVCAAILARYWQDYAWGPPRHMVFTLAVAVATFFIWIAPQEVFHQPRRLDGFDPWFFGDHGGVPAMSIIVRFIRLVVVVPLLEEIFWRGFLLRYLIHHDFMRVPFGTFRWSSFCAVSLLFAVAHWGPDFVPALITGALFNLVAYRTKSLVCCVITHAVTNLLLGIYIMKTGQWGFW
jgi:CAAX prenyl protease-like protein